MEKPIVAQKAPYLLELEPGTYYWCACGKSKSQPFCDGSHKGGEFSPVKFTVTEKKMNAFCGCKQSKSQPFCDGTHSSL